MTVEIETIKPTGIINVVGNGDNTKSATTSSIKTLYSKYPMKLISTNTSSDNVTRTAYILGYGGGIVQGDKTRLIGTVSNGANLILLTQGSTKVFKNEKHIETEQNIEFKIDDATLIMLPDPVVCFKDAVFIQHQNYYLEKDSNLLLLDWYCSGRKALDEIWLLKKYFSKIQVFKDNQLIAKEIINLQQNDLLPLNQRMDKYHTLAFMLIYGKQFHILTNTLMQEFKCYNVNNITKDDLIWSFDKLEDLDNTYILRASTIDLDPLRCFFRLKLQAINHLVNVDKLFN